MKAPTKQDTLERFIKDNKFYYWGSGELLELAEKLIQIAKNKL